MLTQNHDADVESAKLRLTIQEQNTDIQDLSLNLERAKWIIRYLEQRNKKRQKEQDRLRILVEASVAQHSAS